MAQRPCTRTMKQEHFNVFDRHQFRTAAWGFLGRSAPIATIRGPVRRMLGCCSFPLIIHSRFILSTSKLARREGSGVGYVPDRPASLSPDDKWIAFVLRRGSAFRIYIAPHDGTVKREDQWVAITDESFVDHLPHWSPTDGCSTSIRIGMATSASGPSAWTLDPSIPWGNRFAVATFPHCRQALKNVPLIMRGMSLTHDQIILNAGEATG